MTIINNYRQEQVWRAFYTRPRTEKKVEGDLLRKGLNVFLPKIERVQKWSDRTVKVVEPLFSGYIFGRVTERERLEALRTAGIVRTVGFGGRHSEVSEQEIEQLRTLVASPHLIKSVVPNRPRMGEVVEVISGPLWGLTGSVQAYRGSRYLVLYIDSIGSGVRAVIDDFMVRVVHSRSH